MRTRFDQVFIRANMVIFKQHGPDTGDFSDDLLSILCDRLRSALVRPDNGVCVWCAVETLTVVSQGHLNIGKGAADITCQAVDGRMFKNLKQGKVIADKSRQRILRAGQQQRMRASFNQVVIWPNIVILDQPGPDAGDVCCKLLFIF